MVEAEEAGLSPRRNAKYKIPRPPKPIPDSPENIARALVTAKPKRDSKRAAP